MTNPDSKGAAYTDDEIKEIKNKAQVTALRAMRDTFISAGAPVQTADSIRTVESVCNALRNCADLLEQSGGVIDDG